MTTPREHAALAARNAAVIWLYQRAADQACINASYPKHVAHNPAWVKSQQTVETSRKSWNSAPKHGPSSTSITKEVEDERSDQ